jgi:hypothetical protein
MNEASFSIHEAGFSESRLPKGNEAIAAAVLPCVALETRSLIIVYVGLDLRVCGMGVSPVQLGGQDAHPTIFWVI